MKCFVYDSPVDRAVDLIARIVFAITGYKRHQESTQSSATILSLGSIVSNARFDECHHVSYFVRTFLKEPAYIHICNHVQFLRIFYKYLYILFMYRWVSVVMFYVLFCYSCSFIGSFIIF